MSTDTTLKTNNFPFLLLFYSFRFVEFCVGVLCYVYGGWKCKIFVFHIPLAMSNRIAVCKCVQNGIRLILLVTFFCSSSSYVSSCCLFLSSIFTVVQAILLPYACVETIIWIEMLHAMEPISALFSLHDNNDLYTKYDCLPAHVISVDSIKLVWFSLDKS